MVKPPAPGPVGRADARGCEGLPWLDACEGAPRGGGGGGGGVAAGRPNEVGPARCAEPGRAPPRGGEAFGVRFGRFLQSARGHWRQVRHADAWGCAGNTVQRCEPARAR